eukprot:g13863.t1
MSLLPSGPTDWCQDVGVKVALMVIILLLILSFLLPSTHDLSFQLVLSQLDLEARHFYSNETSPDVPQEPDKRLQFSVLQRRAEMA